MKCHTWIAAGICALVVAFASVGDCAARTLSSWCGSDATIGVSSAHVLVCPQGDGQSLADAGATITVQVISDQGSPTPSFPPEDIWVLGCNEGWTTLCLPMVRVIDADGPTDENGITTLSGAIRAGGSGTGLWLMVRGEMATGDWFPCTEPICLPITVVSPDIDGDLDVDLVDLSLFTGAWPPQPFSFSRDLNGDGVINLIDLTLFAQHLSHSC